MSKIKAYLAGSTKAENYRSYCHSDPSIKENFILNDPLQNTHKLFEEHNLCWSDIVTKSVIIPKPVRQIIVKEDKSLILQSDCVIAYIEQPTFGTVMEIMFAHIWKIPVYVINPSKSHLHDVWLSVHWTAIFNDIDKCFAYVLLNNKRLLEEGRKNV